MEKGEAKTLKEKLGSKQTCLKQHKYKKEIDSDNKSPVL